MKGVAPIVVLMVGSVLFLGAKVYAQENTVSGGASQNKRSFSTQLEEVVVTAQKRSESVNDVPLSITALSGDSLDRFGITDTRDLSKVTPGFSFSKSGVGTPVYTLRGVGFNDQSFFASPTVSVYVDEVPLPFSFMTKGASLDLERVEVLKGPQGTLYGRNTTGGAINYIVNKPTDTLSWGASGTYSRFETTEVSAFVSGPITERLRARIAIKDMQSRKGWQKSVSRPDDELGTVDRQALRALAEWTPTDTLDVRLSFDMWRDRSEAQTPQAIAVIPQNPFTGAAVQSPRVENAELVPVDTDDNRIADWSNEFDWHLNDKFMGGALNLRWSITDDLSLTSISSYGDARSDGSMLPAGLDALVSDYRIDAIIRTMSQELRLEGIWGDSFDWMIGTNFGFDQGSQHNHAYDRDVSSAFPILGVTALFTEVGVTGANEASQESLFVNTNWQPTDSWKFTLGARYNNEKTEFEGCSFDETTTEGTGLAPLFTAVALTRGSVTPIAAGECFSLDDEGSNDIFQGELNENSISGRFAANFTPNDDTLIYASYSRGTKSGGFPVLPASDQSQYEPVTQEKLSAFEVGSKLGFNDGAGQFNNAIFYYDYTDKQLLTRVRDPFFGPLPILKNAPSSIVYGAELSVSSAPFAGLYVSLAASYIKTKIKEFESLDINGDPQDFAGRPFNYSPKVQANALVDYSFAISQEWDGGIGIDVSYSDQSNATLEGNELYNLRAYTIVNARFRVSTVDERWSMSAWGRNITNEFQAVNVYSIADVVGRYTGMPATYGFTLNYRYE